jgi:hypothetical protein
MSAPASSRSSMKDRRRTGRPRPLLSNAKSRSSDGARPFEIDYSQVRYADFAADCRFNSRRDSPTNRFFLSAPQGAVILGDKQPPRSAELGRCTSNKGTELGAVVIQIDARSPSAIGLAFESYLLRRVGQNDVDLLPRSGTWPPLLERMLHPHFESAFLGRGGNGRAEGSFICRVRPPVELIRKGTGDDPLRNIRDRQ